MVCALADTNCFWFWSTLAQVVGTVYIGLYIVVGIIINILDFHEKKKYRTMMMIIAMFYIPSIIIVRAIAELKEISFFSAIIGSILLALLPIMLAYIAYTFSRSKRDPWKI